MSSPISPPNVTGERLLTYLVRWRLPAALAAVVAVLLLSQIEAVARPAVGLLAGVLTGMLIYATLALVERARTYGELDTRTAEIAGWLAQARASADELVAELSRERHISAKLKDQVSDLEQQIVDLGDELETLRLAKSEFMARMSHELRTPLNAIVGYSELVLEGIYGELGDKQRDRLERILRNGRGLLGLINDILDLSQIDTGHLELTFSPVSVADALHRAIASMEQPAREKGLPITLEIADDLPPIYADESRLRQVVASLLDNAVKFTEEGHIVVRASFVHVEPAGVGPFSQLHQGDWLVVSVADTGIGVSPELHQEIFDEFVQADTSATRGYGGSGLGLAITKRLVEMHSGRIWLESRAGEGSTFSFGIPYTHLDEAGRPTTAQIQPASDRPLILVVDDAEDAREIIASHLSQAGYTVAHAEGGEQALELARGLRPDVMILDILMPDMDGWGVLEHLQAEPKTADIAVVTASIVDNQRRAVRRGALGHITKPIERTALLGAISRAIVARSRPAILVVDDDPAARSTLTGVLRLAGYPAIPIESADAAISWLQERRVGLVLLDFQQAQDDVRRVLDFMQGHPTSARTPALVISAEAPSEEALHGDQIRVLPKRGLAQDVLLESVDRVMETYGV